MRLAFGVFATVMLATADDCRVRIGATPLRLPDAAALQAFRPDVEYSVYYLEGAVAVVLSA